MKRKEKVAYLKVENNFHVELLRPHREKAKKKKNTKQKSRSEGAEKTNPKSKPNEY